MGKGRSASAVAASARRLYREGLLHGTSGNVSVRDGDRIAITPSGRPWKGLRAESIVLVEGDTATRGTPSSELPLHQAIYAHRADVQAIVHTHSRFATVFSILRREIEAVHYLLAFAGPRVRVADYACYGTDALAASCVATLGADRAVLLANHGLVAVAPTLEDAERVARSVEEVAALAWHAQAIGKPVVLSDAQMAEVAGHFASYGRGE